MINEEIKNIDKLANEAIDKFIDQLPKREKRMFLWFLDAMEKHHKMLMRLDHAIRLGEHGSDFNELFGLDFADVLMDYLGLPEDTHPNYEKWDGKKETWQDDWFCRDKFYSNLFDWGNKSTLKTTCGHILLYIEGNKL